MSGVEVWLLTDLMDVISSNLKKAQRPKTRKSCIATISVVLSPFLPTPSASAFEAFNLMGAWVLGAGVRRSRSCVAGQPSVPGCAAVSVA
jgi:hypothetical protein